MIKPTKFYICVVFAGSYQFIESVTNEPKACLTRLEAVRKNIPSAVLSTPMSYRAIFSQLNTN